MSVGPMENLLSHVNKIKDAFGLIGGVYEEKFNSWPYRERGGVSNFSANVIAIRGVMTKAMSHSVHLTRGNIEAWEGFTKSSINFLDQYRGLLDTYVLDFFTEDLWSKLNPKWRAVLESLTPIELANFLSSDSPLKQRHVWPLSLLAFRTTAFAYTLPRKPITSADPFMIYFNKQIPTSQSGGMECHDKSTSKDGSNLETAEDSKSLGLDTQALPKPSSVIIKNSKSDVTAKHTEEFFTKQNEVINSVMEVGVKCKDPAHCGSIQNVDYSENFEIKETKDFSSKSACMEELDSSRHLYQQQKIHKDMEISIHPIQQMSVTWGDAASELSAAAGQHKLLQHVFRRHLKPKKQHEIARLALIAGQVAKGACDGVMIDVGSGQGHLSRLLAYGHKVRVVCLEAQDKFISGAKKFDSQLEIAVGKMKSRQTSLPALPPAPRHAVCLLEPNMSPQKFREVVTRAWPELQSKGATCGLIGLHTCGNLAPTMLRIFTNMPPCQAVISVGCCYMKLDTVSNGTEYLGYPMSKLVQSLPGNMLSYEAREVACHAIEMYTNRLQLGADNLKVHCYRASLEEILIKNWPQHRHAGLRSINHAHKMEFAQYCLQAVSRLQDVKIPQEDINSERTKHNLSQWMQVVIYYSLRLLLAPVVESVVLLDRLLFLYEKGVESILIPAFDPQLSPRNQILIAVKPYNKI